MKTQNTKKEKGILQRYYNSISTTWTMLIKMQASINIGLKGLFWRK